MAGCETSQTPVSLGHEVGATVTGTHFESRVVGVQNQTKNLTEVRPSRFCERSRARWPSWTGVPVRFAGPNHSYLVPSPNREGPDRKFLENWKLHEPDALADSLTATFTNLSTSACFMGTRSPPVPLVGLASCTDHPSLLDDRDGGGVIIAGLRMRRTIFFRATLRG